MAQKKEKIIRVKLVKSTIGYSEYQKRVVKGLGLKRLHKVIELKDTPEVRGMINKIPHLVRYEVLS